MNGNITSTFLWWSGIKPKIGSYTAKQTLTHINAATTRHLSNINAACHGAERHLLINDENSLVTHEKAFLAPEESKLLFRMLMERGDWSRDHLPMKGNSEFFVSPRRVCAYGDVGLAYTYTGITRPGEGNPSIIYPFISTWRRLCNLGLKLIFLKKKAGWPAFLLDVKRRVEDQAQQPFNFVFCNLYASQHEYIGWFVLLNRTMMMIALKISSSHQTFQC